MSDFVIFDEGAEYLLREKRLGSRILAELAPSKLLELFWRGAVYEDRGILLPRLFGGADFIGFNEGRIVVEDTGWPNTVYFDLSAATIGTGLVATTGWANRATWVITGTTYGPKNQTQPVPTGLGSLVFNQMTWTTGSDTNWSNAVKTIVATDNAAKIFCAWNLIAGGSTRDMSQPNTTLNVTPTYAPANPP